MKITFQCKERHNKKRTMYGQENDQNAQAEFQLLEGDSHLQNFYSVATPIHISGEIVATQLSDKTKYRRKLLQQVIRVWRKRV
jgi:hypothetical protein